MKIQLKRKDAIKMVQMYYLLNLTVQEKGDVLLDNNVKVEYNHDENKWQEEDVLLYKNNKYILQKFSYSEFVTNYYIEEQIFAFFGAKVTIIDKVAFCGESCTCCGFVIAKEIDSYDVCPVCMWEATCTGEGMYSSPNHATLSEYRHSFLKKMNSDNQNILYKKYHKLLHIKT